jgi:hypothetical protein
MDLKPLPFRSTLEQYQKPAEALLEAHGSGDSQAIRVFHENHPRFLDSETKWLPENLPDSEIQSAALELADVQLTIARWYDFQSRRLCNMSMKSRGTVLRPSSSNLRVSPHQRNRLL